jgi:hypothetical protein
MYIFDIRIIIIFSYVKLFLIQNILYKNQLRKTKRDMC